MCQEFRNTKAVSGSLIRLQDSCQSRLQSPEGLTGDEGFISKVAFTHDWHIGVGFWQEASVSPQLGLSAKLLECPYNAAGFPLE